MWQRRTEVPPPPGGAGLDRKTEGVLPGQGGPGGGRAEQESEAGPHVETEEKTRKEEPPMYYNFHSVMLVKSEGLCPFHFRRRQEAAPFQRNRMLIIGYRRLLGNGYQNGKRLKAASAFPKGVTSPCLDTIEPTRRNLG